MRSFVHLLVLVPALLAPSAQALPKCRHSKSANTTGTATSLIGSSSSLPVAVATSTSNSTISGSASSSSSPAAVVTASGSVSGSSTLSASAIASGSISASASVTASANISASASVTASANISASASASISASASSGSKSIASSTSSAPVSLSTGTSGSNSTTNSTTVYPGHPCNTAKDRSCWTDSFNINTDYETSVPYTGVTREYTIVITEQENWTGPDGFVKSKIMLINGTLPGPQLTADWGDRLSITVINKLETNGTSIHWHGIRQLNNNMQDGVNGVTECPLPPNATKTYHFLAEQYGTTWYHSHFSAQYGNGVWGTLVINGPASAPYDIDLGPFPVNDYYYAGADELVELTKKAAPPNSDNVLFNGTNISPLTGEGAYANVTLVKGMKHRLRIINPSVENHFILSLANHNFTIIASDLVPVEPLVVNYVFVGPGQRHDIIIEANQPSGSYWFNASFVASAACGGSVNSNAAAIFRYSDAPDDSLPTIPGETPQLATCSDNIDIVPVVKRNVDLTNFLPRINNTLDITLSLNFTASQIFTWKVNSSAIDINWQKPIDQYIFESNTSYPSHENVVQVNDKDQWMIWLIENDPAVGLPHPIHLHGHDFVLLGRSDVDNGTPFNATTDLAKLSGANGVRRDVMMLPALGWIAIAFKSDNPGTWLMHCHIAWHVSGGLGVSFVERPDDYRNVAPQADIDEFNSQCAAWNEYYPSIDPFLKDDSGL